MKYRKIIFAICLICPFLWSYACPSNVSSEEKEIKQLLNKELGTNSLGEPVQFKEISGPYISGDYALVGVLYEPEGASELILVKKENKWSILEGGGGAFTDKHLIETLKLPPSNVKEIFRQAYSDWYKKEPSSLDKK